ncbi:MAG: hypothetical protein HC898_13355 [Phycisphaerales bacterium]|nr:hypothetical protein [Phycisphaerales bacterium]
MKFAFILIVLVLLAAKLVFAQQTTRVPDEDAGAPTLSENILSEYFPSGGYQLVRYKDPGAWTEVNALNNPIGSIRKDDPQFDASLQLIKIVEHYQNTGKRVKIVYPAGDYYFKSPCTLKKMTDCGLPLRAEKVSGLSLIAITKPICGSFRFSLQHPIFLKKISPDP